MGQKFKETGLEVDKRAYKKVEKEVKKNVKNAKNYYAKKIAKKGKLQPKQFYEYVKKERKQSENRTFKGGGWNTSDRS